MRKIHIHPLFWTILGIGALSGLFKEIIMLFAIVFIHELGHCYMAYRFHWRIKTIMLLPFGGMAEMEEYGNKPVREEILVILAGPAQHLWLILGSFFLLYTPFWTEVDHRIFLFHNLSILLFNLLPILPLDGGRLMFSVLSSIYPFYTAFYIHYYLSIFFLISLTTIALFVIPFHLNLIAVVMFLWLHHYLEWQQRHFVFLRFLMERMRRGNNSFVKKQVVPISPAATVSDAMKKVNRQAYHYFSSQKTGAFIEERILLHAYFDKEKRLFPVEKFL